MLLPGAVANILPAPVPTFTPGIENFTITEATSGFDIGYSDSTDHSGMGSVVPTTTSGPFDLKAAYIQGLGIYFRLRISGNHASAAVTQVEIVGHETVTEADDLFSYAYDAGDDYTEWQFNVASAYWDGAGTSDINVTFA